MYENKSYHLHPFTRVAILLVGILCILVFNNPVHLVILELLLLPVLALNSGIKTLLHYILVGVLPLTAMWMIFFKTTGHFGDTIFLNQMIKIVKLIIVTTTTQIAIAVPQKYVQDTFRKLGFKGEKLLVIIGAYFVWIDIVRRTHRILLARFAQGYVGKRTFINKLRQLPVLLVPLMTGVLRTAKTRADSWARKDVMRRLDAMEYDSADPYNVFNILVVLLVTVIVIISCFQIVR